MKDPIIKPKNLYKFESGFSNFTTLKVESSGHFPQEEEPALVSKTIINFVKK
jgi:haloalkane dehalogenase